VFGELYPYEDAILELREWEQGGEKNDESVGYNNVK
jgi:hypothetical protein